MPAHLCQLSVYSGRSIFCWAEAEGRQQCLEYMQAFQVATISSVCVFLCFIQAYSADHGSNSSSSPTPATPQGDVAIHTGSSSSCGGNRFRMRPTQLNLGLAKQAGATADLPDYIVYSNAAAAEALLKACEDDHGECDGYCDAVTVGLSSPAAAAAAAINWN